MLKRKKRSYKKENKLEEEKKIIQSNETVDSAKNLSQAISKTIDGLFYMSETDAEFLPFIGRLAKSVSKEEISLQTESSPEALIEERNFSEFFKRLTEVKDWFGDEEMMTIKKFADLKELLENNLSELKVFKIGKIQLDIYIVGLEASGILMGVKTKAVET